MRQKEESYTLIHSIFPKAIAKNLIAKSGNPEDGVGSSSSFVKRNILDSTLACMHQDITILFTDIVGFTSMSQTCQPFEVMSFLHNLFTAFDDLVDLDSDLWKVETIGDAFMVASGLGVTSSDASMRETMVDLEYRVDGRENDNSSGMSTFTRTVSVKSKQSAKGILPPTKSRPKLFPYLTLQVLRKFKVRPKVVRKFHYRPKVVRNVCA